MRILIIEDQARTARELQKGLAASGIVARVAASGEEALQLLQAESFEALVVDVMLPGLSGLDLEIGRAHV